MERNGSLVSFTAHCLSSLSCIDYYQAMDIGGYMQTNRSDMKSAFSGSTDWISRHVITYVILVVVVTQVLIYGSWVKVQVIYPMTT